MENTKKIVVVLVLFAVLGGIVTLSAFRNSGAESTFNVEKQLDYCNAQINRTLLTVGNDSNNIPRSIDLRQNQWQFVNIYDWTSGFWPGILWYNYENTQDESIRQIAENYTEALQQLSLPEHDNDHDIGFQLFCSFGNAYRQTGNDAYRKIILKGAGKLAQLYNPVVGTTLSWPNMVEEKGWPHNTILDNMMNLEILFWASKHGGRAEWFDMAVNHARKTMNCQFREDGTSYHVAIYDTITGGFIKGVTNQGYSDRSFWARGQAWSIYGFTMVYRETGDAEFLRFAEKIADVYLKRLPADKVPYWDFDDPAIPNAPKDASAAAITASALLELSQLEDDRDRAKHYRTETLMMLSNLSSEKYLSGKSKPSFLLHSTGNYPGGYEIDASINYADHYYIEALMRYKKMQEGLSVLATLK